MNARKSFADILQVPAYRLEDVAEVFGRPQGVYDFLEGRREELIQRMAGKKENAQEVRAVLREAIQKNEQELRALLGISNDLDFEKIAESAREIATEQKGFFLKKELAADILRVRPPESMLKYFGYRGTEELLEKQDIGEVFSALRFTETNEWMHETFKVAYEGFTPEDFEERAIELRVLGPQWREIAEKYVAKKHHNVSHLKEFGVIFLNPIAETGEGKFLRDFALLIHYFHEIAFYSKLFRSYAELPEFNQLFLSLLRGDVPEEKNVEKGEFLILQRYLWKENPDDARLFLPRVNPEALHWRKAEQDIVEFGKKQEGSSIELWDDTDWVAGIFGSELVSFDMEDNAMGVASGGEYFYHQREALWNRIFAEFAGGYEMVERHILENMGKGLIRLS